jgi:hypothetical protein
MSRADFRNRAKWLLADWVPLLGTAVVLGMAIAGVGGKHLPLSRFGYGSGAPWVKSIRSF